MNLFNNMNTLKRIIKEEIATAKLQLLTESINSLENECKRLYVLKENIVDSILSLFLTSKYNKKAEKFKESAEYKELVQQIKIASKSIEMLSKRLKDEIESYDKNVKVLHSVGLKITPSMNAMDRWNAYKKWQAARNKHFNKKYSK